MRNLLKYLIPVLMTFAFCSVTGECGFSHSDTCSCSFQINDCFCQDSLTATDSELNIPRQVQLSGPLRLQSNIRRTNSINRAASEFVKSNKVLNINSLCSAQRNTFVVTTSIVEHSHKLVYLGKLMI